MDVESENDPLDFLSELNYSDLDSISLGSTQKRLAFPLNNISNSIKILCFKIPLSIDVLHVDKIKFKHKQSLASNGCPICFKNFKTGILAEKTNFWLKILKNFHNNFFLEN